MQVTFLILMIGPSHKNVLTRKHPCKNGFIVSYLAVIHCKKHHKFQYRTLIYQCLKLWILFIFDKGAR
jgi:hypothetical protein